MINIAMSFTDNDNESPVGLEKYTVCVADRFWLTTLSVEEATAQLQSRRDSSLCLTVSDESVTSDLISSPNKLGHVFQFSKMILPISTKTVVICINPGARSPKTPKPLLEEVNLQPIKVLSII